MLEVKNTCSKAEETTEEKKFQTLENLMKNAKKYKQKPLKCITMKEKYRIGPFIEESGTTYWIMKKSVKIANSYIGIIFK